MLVFAVWIAVVAALSAVAQQFLATSNNKIAYNISRDLRNAAFHKLQRLPLSYLDAHPSGDLVSRMIADVDTFSDGLLMGFTQLFTGVVLIVGTLTIMLIKNWMIALLVVVLTPLSMFVASFIARKTHHYFTEQARVRGQQTALINELIEGQKVVQSFGHEAASLSDFDCINDELGRVSLNATFFSSLTNPSTRYAKPFNEISGVVTELQNALACAARVFSLLDETDRVPDKENAVVLSPKGTVDLKDVCFRYVPDRPLIEGFNLHVKPGQRIAIVGPTGCGKTTMINLLMRFYDVNSGAILVDGTDIRDATRHSLRKSFGMVLQDTWLKAGTIRDNIAYGRPDASEEDVIAAAKAAHAHSFIRRLPDGYDTVITENGGNISQGQKQLLCIARVMLGGENGELPPMLILDEATSSIDTRTEIKIQSAFARLMNGRTSFIVAHRLSTIQEADVILVMKDGHIIEQGTHEELLKKQGFYANLYQSQFALG